MAIISNLLRLIAKPIFLKLGKGLKSSKTQYCLGDELDIRLDDSVVGKDNVIAKPPTRINSLARWVDGDAKQITDSKTVQDDDGNIETKTSFSGTLIDSFSNYALGADRHSIREVAVGPGAGNPILRINRVNTQTWDQYCDRATKNFYIRGTNKENPTQTGDFLQIARNGVVTANYQTTFAAKLGKTPQFGSSIDYQLGGNLAFTVIHDIDGTNPSAGNFFPGDGKGNGAYYKTTYDDKKYLIGYNFIVDTSITHPDGIRYTVTMWYIRRDGSLIAKFPSTGRIPPSSSFQTIGKTQPIIKSVKNAKIYWTVNVIVSAQPYINAFENNNPLSFENYVGGYILP